MFASDPILSNGCVRCSLTVFYIDRSLKKFIFTLVIKNKYLCGPSSVGCYTPYFRSMTKKLFQNLRQKKITIIRNLESVKTHPVDETPTVQVVNNTKNTCKLPIVGDVPRTNDLRCDNPRVNLQQNQVISLHGPFFRSAYYGYTRSLRLRISCLTAVAYQR